MPLVSASRQAYPHILLLSGIGCLLFAALLRGNPNEVKVEIGQDEQVALSESRTSDCGATSLYVVSTMAGLNTPLDELRTRTRTSLTGTTMLQLKEVAIELGLEVDARRCSFDVLERHVSNPGCYAIIHSPMNHFVAVVGGSNGSLRLVDNSLGVLQLDREGLDARYQWEGVALLIRKAE